MQPDSEQVFAKLIDLLNRTVPAFRGLLEQVVMHKQSGVFLAGGAVRDSFLQRERSIKDLDFFLSTLAFERLSSYFKENGNLLNNQFGTYRWYPHSNPLFYFDIIVIKDFFNGLWRCQDIIDVLNQFDMTINAVAFDLYTGEFYNPQNGLRDISENVLRAVRFDYPDIAVSQFVPVSRNSVIWFRYRYYAKKLNLIIEPITQKWIDLNIFREDDFEQFKMFFFDPNGE